MSKNLDIFELRIKCSIFATPKSFMKQGYRLVEKTKASRNHFVLPPKRKIFKPVSWSHLGLNQGLPDYESGALTD